MPVAWGVADLSLCARSPNRPHVGGLRPLFALGDLELDSLTLAQGILARPPDAGGADEDVLSPLIPGVNP